MLIGVSPIATATCNINGIKLEWADNVLVLVPEGWRQVDRCVDDARYPEKYSTKATSLCRGPGEKVKEGGMEDTRWRVTADRGQRG